MEDKCVGDIRVNTGVWYALNENLHNENPYEVTYCSYCVHNQCVQCDNLYQVDYSAFKSWNCNCDCPNKELHKQEDKVVKPFFCDKHKNGSSIMTCDMGRCFKCNVRTSSGMIKCCEGCSATLQICQYCKIGG